MVVIDGFALPLALIDHRDDLVSTGDVLWLEEGPVYPIKDVPLPALNEERRKGQNDWIFSILDPTFKP